MPTTTSASDRLPDTPARHPACYCFAGGGTGGHLMPGLAIAAGLRAREPGCRIIFIGSDRPLEQTILKDAADAHYAVPVASSQIGLRNPIRFVWRNWRGYRYARAILKQERPRAVIGLGGFVSAPGVYAAARCGVPNLILEQNAVPGTATRWLCNHADLVCLSFPAMDNLPERHARQVLTGNPVRREIMDAARRAQGAVQAQRTLLILGGSQGATGVNEAVLRLIAAMPSAFRGWRIVHQTGAEHLAGVRARYAEAGVPHEVESFFSDMPQRYQQATLVISRAGATTLAELACAGRPAILIPYPRAAYDHQRLNAEMYTLAGGARLVEESRDASITADRLGQALLPLLHDPHAIVLMRQKMRAVAVPGATDAILDLLKRLLQEAERTRESNPAAPRVHTP